MICHFRLKGGLRFHVQQTIQVYKKANFLSSVDAYLSQLFNIQRVYCLFVLTRENAKTCKISFVKCCFTWVKIMKLTLLSENSTKIGQCQIFRKMDKNRSVPNISKIQQNRAIQHISNIRQKLGSAKYSKNLTKSDRGNYF